MPSGEILYMAAAPYEQSEVFLASIWSDNAPKQSSELPYD